VRFENCYASDTPCLPSRTALFSGRCGYHTGVVGHGGTAAQPFIEGPHRVFWDKFDLTSWMHTLRQCGHKTATISSFAERHGAWHWLAGFNEVYNPGRWGWDVADDITPLALKWIRENARADDWFLHVNYWDPHVPYRTPASFGNPFEEEPLPAWLTEEARQRMWESCGPHGAQEPHGWGDPREFERIQRDYPRMPRQIDSMEAVRQMIDGYDVSLRYVDVGIGQVLNALADANILEDTVIMISADHAECHGELNVWGDHLTADYQVTRVPLIVRWPGLTDAARVERSLHYQYDWAATLVELAGCAVPGNWDGTPFTEAFRVGHDTGRAYLVTSGHVWSSQRSVRFDDYLCIRTYHDGYRDLPPLLLFDVANDPHEQRNLADERPTLVDHAMRLLTDWQHDMILTSAHGSDPMLTVLHEGGPFHARGCLPGYADRLRATGRAHHAERLEALHPDEMNEFYKWPKTE
jgi:arylsulfatase A-like enzyme